MFHHLTLGKPFFRRILGSSVEKWLLNDCMTQLGALRVVPFWLLQRKNRAAHLVVGNVMLILLMPAFFSPGLCF